MQLFRLFLQVLLIYYLAPIDLILVFYAVVAVFFGFLLFHCVLFVSLLVVHVWQEHEFTFANIGVYMDLHKKNPDKIRISGFGVKKYPKIRICQSGTDMQTLPTTRIEKSSDTI